MLSEAVILCCLLTAASAHMSIWHPSMYGVGPDWAYDAGPPMNPIGPGLATQDEWWFRGPEARALPPQEGAVMELPAGGSITFEIACHYAFTSYGYATSVPGSELDACPGPNAGPYHAGDPDSKIIDHSLISGCALTIADVDDISKVTMDNLAIFSVQHNCVQQKMTDFEIPARMPACTGEKCICGWFWLTNNGTANFYMTAFDCAVTGSPIDATAIAAPRDPVFCKGGPSSCTKGSKRPIYAYNSPSNVPWIGNYDRAGYHESWSFGINGAQNDIFEPPKLPPISSASSVISTSTTSISSSRLTIIWSSSITSEATLSPILTSAAVSTVFSTSTISTSNSAIQTPATSTSTSSSRQGVVGRPQATRAASVAASDALSSTSSPTPSSSSSAPPSSATAPSFPPYVVRNPKVIWNPKHHPKTTAGSPSISKLQERASTEGLPEEELAMEQRRRDRRAKRQRHARDFRQRP